MLRTTLFLFLVACGGNKPAPASVANPPPAPAAEARTAPAASEAAATPSAADIAAAITQLGEFRDQMCACADKACAEKIEQTLSEWGQAMAAKFSEQPDLSDEQEQAFMVAATEFSTCAHKLYEAAAEATDEPS